MLLRLLFFFLTPLKNIFNLLLVEPGVEVPGTQDPTGRALPSLGHTPWHLIPDLV